MKRTKFLSFLLAAMIVLSSVSCLSVVSFAANVIDCGYTADTENNEDIGTRVVAWEYLDDKSLQIYGDVSSPKWSKYADQIEKVVYTAKNPDEKCEVTIIPEKAFYGFTNLLSVDMTEATNLGTIGAYAFNGCTSLVRVSIPNTVINVLDYAFYGCTGLVYASLSNSLINVGKNVFKGCTSLETVVVPNGVERIGYGMFEGCSALATAELPDSVELIDAHAFEGCSALTNAIIPDSVETVGSYAFYESGVVNAYIGHKVTDIGQYVFGRCSSLETVEFTSAIGEISDWMFYNCTSLETIVDFPESVEAIGAHAFEGCSALTDVVIPNTVTNIAESAFAGCSSLASVELSTALTTIGTNAFNGAAIMSVDIPYNVNEIGAGAFSGCASLTAINVDGANATYKSVDGVVYTADMTELVICPAGKTGDVIIPDSVTTIGNNAFAGCTSLTSVTIPASVESISASAFNGCESTVTIKTTCDAAAALYATIHSINADVSHLGTETWVVVDEPTCEQPGLKEQQCTGCGNVIATEVVDPLNHDYHLVESKNPTCDLSGYNKYECNNCHDVYTDGIPATGVHTYAEDERVDATCTDNGYIIHKCSTCGDTYVETLTAFGHSYDEGVLIKNPTVDEQGEIEYTCQNEGCGHKYTAPVSNSVFSGMKDTNYGAYFDPITQMFVNLHWFITYDNELYIISDEAEDWRLFYEDEIEVVYITGNATVVENGSFAQMPNLKRAEILFSLGTIEAYAFQQCPKLETVITGSIGEIGDFAFYKCPSLKTVDIYGGLPEGKVGKNVFFQCAALETVKLGNGTLEIGNSMFMECPSIKEVTLPESITVIGDSAFDGTSITEIRIPKDVHTIEKGAFTNCTSLTSINVDGKNDFYFSEDGVLYDMALSSLVLCPAGKTGEVEIWEGTQTIEADAFIGCQNITKVIVPKSVTSIAENAFIDCADDMTIVCDCDSVAYAYALHRGFNTEITHVASDVWEITTAPTCLADGAKERVCSGCGHVYETVPVPALGHDYNDGEVTTKATCETDGVVTFTCTREGCSESYTEVLPKTEHAWDAGVVIVEATCTTEGTKRFTCKNSGCYDYYDVPISALGHAYDEGVITTPATCTTDGVITFTCTNEGCGESFTEVIAATGHNYQSVEVKAATCIENGKIVHTCLNCGDSYEEATTGEHQLYSTKVKVNPTCTKEGTEGWMCAVCNQFIGETTTLPKVDHNYVNGTCTGCGASNGTGPGSGGTIITPEETPGDDDSTVIPTVPATPKLLLIRNLVEGISVTWKEVDGATGYRVYRRGAGAKSWTYLCDVDKCEYLDTEAETGAYWRYTVRAVNDNGFSGYENGIYIKRVDAPNMKSVTATASGIKVTWSSVSNATGYRVYRRGAGQSWVYITTVKGTSYVDTAIKDASGYYRYTVRAVDGYYSSYESGLVIKFVAAPHLTSIKNTTNGIKVTWDAVAGADGYRVYRRGAGQSWVYITTITDTTFVDTAVKDATGYYRYTVRAVDGNYSAYESGLVIKR